MKNKEHSKDLLQLMYAVEECSPLDEYASTIFGRPIQNTWKQFRYLTRYSIPGSWMWDPDIEIVEFSTEDVPTLVEFAKLLLYETARGYCHLNKPADKNFEYPLGFNEEQVCKDICQLVCEFLHLKFNLEISNQTHKLVSVGMENGGYLPELTSTPTTQNLR